MESKNKAIEKYSTKHNLFYADKIIKALKDDDVDTEFKSSAVAMLAAQAVSFIAFIISLCLRLNTYLMVLSGIIVFQTPLVYFLTGLLLKERDGRLAKYFAATAFAIELPMLYCFSGGLKGPGLVWCMFSVLIMSLVFPTKISLYMAFCNGIVIMVTVVITDRYPWLIKGVDDKYAQVNTFLCALVVATSISITTYVQKKIANRREGFLDSIKAALTDKNETLEAMNEEIIATNDDLFETTKKLNNLLEEKQHDIESQRRFHAMLNHELRNPLNGIMGYLQIQLMNPNLPAENRKNIEGSLALTETMLQTINDILDFSKMQEGKFEISKASFSLDEVIHNIHTIFDSQAIKKGLRLEINEQPCSYNLLTDGTRLQQIITNLLSNSVKYTDAGEVKVQIDVDKDKELLNVSVSDTGKGMSEDELNEIFVPYKRFNMQENRKIQGTGLGMCIVKSLVEGLNGEINITSKVGVGTTFYIAIPVKILSENASVKNRALETEKLDLTGRHILVVDDDSINIKIIGAFLRSVNARMISAKDGTDAYTIIASKKVPIDMMITDNLMPEMTGCELKELIIKEELDVPSILLTGAVDDEAMAVFNEVGFEGILSKPIIKDALYAKIQEILSA